MWHDSGNCVVHINILTEKSIGMAGSHRSLSRAGKVGGVHCQTK